MIRWTPKTPAPTPQRWQSREEILKAHLDSLAPDELFRVRPYYYWLRFGSGALKSAYARKYDPNQPRDDHGRWVDSGGEGMTNNPLESFAAARRRGRSVAYCMAQYAVDGLMCNSVERSRREPCWKQAAERLAACLGGRQIPPFNY